MSPKALYWFAKYNFSGRREQRNILEHLQSISNTVEGLGMVLYEFGDRVYTFGILHLKESK
jgi:hypothetical protein